MNHCRVRAPKAPLRKGSLFPALFLIIAMGVCVCYNACIDFVREARDAERF